MRQVDRIVHPMPPVCDAGSRRLILGSMPGSISLAVREYYAHPRNQFWDIMGRMFFFDRSLPYLDRLNILRLHGIALWDVIASCRRKGSLDAHIQRGSVRHHTIATLLHKHPGINLIGFNGREAERQFRLSLQMERSDWPGHVSLVLLPSTSPAMAALSFDAKFRIWRTFLQSEADGHPLT